MHSEDFRKAILSALQDDSVQKAIAAIVGESLESQIVAFRLESEHARRNISSLRQQLDQRDVELVALKRDVRQLESQMESLEQYSRRNSIRISGVAEDDSEDATQKTMSVFEGMALSHPVLPTDIDRLHRVGKRGPHPRPILVKFATYAARQRVMKARRSLNNTSFYLNEDVTRQRSQLLYQFRQLKAQRKINKVWTHDGTIIVQDSVNKIHYPRVLHEANTLLDTLKRLSTVNARS